MHKKNLTEKMLRKPFYSFYYNSSKYYDFELYNKTRNNAGDILVFAAMRATDKVRCLLHVQNDTVVAVKNYY
jgi:hypothetical protein